MSHGSVRMICPNLKCRSILTVPAAARGKTVRCRNCGMRIRVPAPQTQPPPQPETEQAAEPSKSDSK